MATNKKKLRVLFLSATNFGEALLKELIDKKIDIIGILSIPEKFRISYSAKKVTNRIYVDFKPYARRLKVPFFEVDSLRGKRISDYENKIRELKPDLILVMGWYYKVPDPIQKIATYGAWGIHASLLPEFSGGAPLVWAIIEGKKKTGVTLFRLKESIDDGDIIAQRSIPIKFDDTIKEVYAKATDISKKMLVNNILKLPLVRYKPQKKGKRKYYPQRSPEDGLINFKQPAKKIYDFIRAQSNPYPGAFFLGSDGKKVIIESARLEKK